MEYQKLVDKSKYRITDVHIDLISGILAGICSTLVSHPFDTVRIRMQLHEGMSLRLGNSMKNVYRNEGFMGLYKGVMSPIVGRAPISAMYQPPLS